MPSAATSQVVADPTGDLAFDRGAVGLFQAVRALGSTASLLHTTSHPDDEQAGMLTRTAREFGARTTLLSLNRGEAGANAIGAELFDELGLIRTEELLLSGRHYGLAGIYFTNAVDYGYSKTLGEAMRSWDREAVLEDMVRVIRMERPLVVVSRWHGSERDGHGHHQAAGVLTPEAVAAAADPARFPRQIQEEGLRPWTVQRLFRGGVGVGEPTDVVFETTVLSPWLGRTYQELASYGLSLQRSQTSGRIRRTAGPTAHRYQRLDDPVGAQLGQPATDFFQGMDLSLSGIPNLTGEVVPAEAANALVRAEQLVRDAEAALDISNPAAVVPPLDGALSALRAAHSLMINAPDARRIVGQKILDAQDALRLAHGVTLRAFATDRDGNPVHRVAGGQSFQVEVALNPGTAHIADTPFELSAPDGWTVMPLQQGRFQVTVAETAPVTGVYFGRTDIRETMYRSFDARYTHRPWRPSPLRASVQLRSGKSHFEVTSPVRGEEPDLPRGVDLRELQVVPRVSVALDPGVVVVPLESWGEPQRFTVTVEQAAGTPNTGDIRLETPVGWRVTPQSHSFSTGQPQERTSVEFTVTPAGPPPSGPIEIRAVARVHGSDFTMTERRVVHPDLEPRSHYAPATALARAVDASIVGSPRVAYVEGVGDGIPTALAALGTPPTLLDAEAIDQGDLSQFDVIVVGTRAYAVHPELTTQNARILEYVRGGGHLVVLYQTPEFDAAGLAPYPAELPRNAEEVSEEDAPVRILAPDHSLVTTPNRLGPLDFEDWVEQRGSKFFASWDREFTPLLETHDTGQNPQQGLWLTAPLDEGHWTYIALALHRQTPYGVPGAYRILANLVSYGHR